MKALLQLKATKEETTGSYHTRPAGWDGLIRLVVHSLCPILKSEIMFLDTLAKPREEVLEVALVQPLTGEGDMLLAIGSDRHTLRSLAGRLGKSKENLAESLGLLLKPLVTQLERLGESRGYSIVSHGKPILSSKFNVRTRGSKCLMLPVQTKLGEITLYFQVDGAAIELLEELKQGEEDSRRIRVPPAQMLELEKRIEKIESIGRKFALSVNQRQSLQEELSSIRKLFRRLKTEPVDNLFIPAKRMATELGRQYGKQVQLTSHGSSPKIDKVILGNLFEPVFHLVRNAVVHGIETAVERQRKGKAVTGQIKCSMAFTEDSLHLIVSDDGRGVDAAKLQNLAQATRSRRKAHSEDDLLQLVFHPELVPDKDPTRRGLITARRLVEAAGGTLRVLSSSDKGTSFEITYPLPRRTSKQ